MNKEYVEMNECEKNHLIKRSKEMLQKEFDYISIDDYEIYNRYIKDKDILNALIMLLGANLEIKKFNAIILMSILIQTITIDFSYMEQKKFV